jgi:hypothetical protein
MIEVCRWKHLRTFDVAMMMVPTRRGAFAKSWRTTSMSFVALLARWGGLMAHFRVSAGNARRFESIA